MKKTILVLVLIAIIIIVTGFAISEQMATNDKSAESVGKSFEGKWIGPEGTSLTITKDESNKPDGYILNFVMLDGPITSFGRANFNNDVQGIAFTRNGQVFTLYHGSGNDTGMKYLAGKTNCIVVKNSEGYCREDQIASTTPSQAGASADSGDMTLTLKDVPGKVGDKQTPPGPGTVDPNPKTNPDPVVPGIYDLGGLNFLLVSFNGVNLDAGARMTLSFERSKKYLNAKFCNSMGGEYDMSGNMITAELMGTLMYCSAPGNVMNIEQAFGSALSSRNGGAKIRYSESASGAVTLTLTGSKGETLVFSKI